jgi:hypothetical protein
LRQILGGLGVPLVQSSKGHKSKHWRLSDFATSKIHEGGALDQCSILFGAAISEIERIADFENEYFTWQNRNSRQSVRSRIYGRHAVYPCIHVTAVETGETKRPLKYVVKALPIGDRVNRNLDDRWLHDNSDAPSLDQFEPELPSDGHGSTLKRVERYAGVCGIEEAVESSTTGLHPHRHGRFREAIFLHRRLDLISENMLDCLFLAFFEDPLFG